MLTNEYAIALMENIHTLEDTEVEDLLKSLVRECDRRFIDYQDTIDEAEQEIEDEIEQELEANYSYPNRDMVGLEEMCRHHADEQGW